MKSTLKKCLIEKNFIVQGERELRKYFIDNFPNQEWTFGGLTKYKDKFLSVDLKSKKLKIIIEYDGIWHYKDIKSQLKNKQYIDSLVNEWCKINNWLLIRIRDEDFLSNKKDTIKKILEQIKGNNVSIS